MEKTALLTRWATGLAAGLSLLAATTPATPQTIVEPPCVATPAPAFESPVQSRWYRRFWTGDCKGLPLLSCMAGRPYWNDVVKTLIGRAAPDKRAEVADRACRLGHAIGFEWSRPITERRINTGDLRKLDEILEKAPDVMAGLAAVEARVRDKAAL